MFNNYEIIDPSRTGAYVTQMGIPGVVFKRNEGRGLQEFYKINDIIESTLDKEEFYYYKQIKAYEPISTYCYIPRFQKYLRRCEQYLHE